MGWLNKKDWISCFPGAVWFAGFGHCRAPCRGALWSMTVFLPGPEGRRTPKVPQRPGRNKSSEDEIFGGGDTVTPSEKVKDDTLSDTMEKKSVTLTGFLNSRTSINYKRASILRDIQVIDSSNFLSYFQGNFGLDVRLLKGSGDISIFPPTTIPPDCRSRAYSRFPWHISGYRRISPRRT